MSNTSFYKINIYKKKCKSKLRSKRKRPSQLSLVKLRWCRKSSNSKTRSSKKSSINFLRQRLNACSKRNHGQKSEHLSFLISLSFSPHHFKRVKISATALVKMVMHTRRGGDLEVMGLMQGKVKGGKKESGFIYIRHFLYHGFFRFTCRGNRD